jgi:Transposase C of IS166 homeodomain
VAARAGRLSCSGIRLRQIDSAIGLWTYAAVDQIHCERADTPDNLPDDPVPLRRIIAAMAQDALTAQAEIARLKFQLARYRRAEFGRSSEKLAREVEQLELALEALETDRRNERWRE